MYVSPRAFCRCCALRATEQATASNGLCLSWLHVHGRQIHALTHAEMLQHVQQPPAATCAWRRLRHIAPGIPQYPSSVSTGDAPAALRGRFARPRPPACGSPRSATWSRPSRPRPIPAASARRPAAALSEQQARLLDMHMESADRPHPDSAPVLAQHQQHLRAAQQRSSPSSKLGCLTCT